MPVFPAGLTLRTSGVRPESRDSDFRIVYASEDPTRYSIVVCPHCGYYKGRAVIEVERA